MPSKTQSILVGGLVAAVTGTILQVAGYVSGATSPVDPNPVLGIIFNILGCMVMLTSGLVAVWHYATENELTLKGSQGVGIGSLAGIVYAVAGIVLGWVLVLLNVLPSPEETLELMRDAGTFDAPGAEQAESITRIMVTWGWVVMAFIGGVLMGLIGGAIGAALFKRGVESPHGEESSMM